MHDLLDGQLSDEQAQRARQMMADDAELAEFYESLREQQSALRALPKYSLDDSFADRVLAAAKSNPDNKVQTGPASTVLNNRQSGWWAPAAVVGTLAAMLLVTLFVIPNLSPESSVARNEKSTADESAGAEPTASEPEEQPEADEDSVITKDKSDTIKKNQQRVIPSLNDSATDVQLGASPSKNLDGEKRSDRPPEDAMPQENLRKSIPKQELSSDDGREKVERMAPPLTDRVAEPSELAPPQSAELKRMRGDIVSGPQNNAGAQMAVVKGTQPAAPQVMVFNIADNQESIQKVNQMLADGGIGLKLPATPQERFSANSEKEAGGRREAQTQKSFAFQVEATPEQMQKTVMELNTETDIVAIDTDKLEMQLADNELQSQAKSLRTREFRRQMSDASGSGRQGGGGLGGGGMAPGASGSGSQAEGSDGDDDEADSDSEPELNLPSAQSIRDIDEYFRLAREEDKLAKRSYTLIFILQDRNASPSTETAPATPVDSKNK